MSVKCEQPRAMRIIDAMMRKYAIKSPKSAYCRRAVKFCVPAVGVRVSVDFRATAVAAMVLADAAGQATQVIAWPAEATTKTSRGDTSQAFKIMRFCAYTASLMREAG